MSNSLAFLFQHKFIISLAVALVVSVYAWKAIPPSDPNSPSASSPGGVALRLFFVTFLSIYLLSFLMEHFDLDSRGKVSGGSGATSPMLQNKLSEVASLRQALKQVDHGAPDF